MNPMYYIFIGVIVLVVAIDFYVKNKNKKSDSTDVDFPKEKENSSNVLIISICSSLIILTIGFFVVDNYYYEGRLSNNEDQFSIYQIISFPKLNQQEIIIKKMSNEKFNAIQIDKFGYYNGLIINGLAQGEWNFYFVNGQLEGKVFYLDGTYDTFGSTGIPIEGREGSVDLFYSNGQMFQKSFFKSGKLNGYYQQWYENGNKRSEYNFIDGKASGLIRLYNQDGQLKEEQEAYIFMGKSYPKYLIKYENNEKYQKAYFSFGEECFDKYEWYENGRVTQMQKYKDCEEFGRRFFY
jgi:antitoxin component YwqK of YwqJK toxin-antitoxin module